MSESQEDNDFLPFPCPSCKQLTLLASGSPLDRAGLIPKLHFESNRRSAFCQNCLYHLSYFAAEPDGLDNTVANIKKLNDLITKQK